MYVDVFSNKCGTPYWQQEVVAFCRGRSCQTFCRHCFLVRYNFSTYSNCDMPQQVHKGKGPLITACSFNCPYFWTESCYKQTNSPSGDHVYLMYSLYIVSCWWKLQFLVLTFFWIWWFWCHGFVKFNNHCRKGQMKKSHSGETVHICMLHFPYFCSCSQSNQ